MKKLLTITLGTLLVLAVSGCMGNKSMSGGDIASTLKEAKMYQKQANKGLQEFRFVGKYIKDAEKLLKEGQKDEARMLANKALTQAKRGVKQAKISKKVWMSAVPK